MKVIRYEEYGPPAVLQAAEAPEPRLGAGEMLVELRAATVNYGDLLARDLLERGRATFNMPWPFWLAARQQLGWQRPKRGVLGSEYSGVVRDAGEGAPFHAGEEVFGYLGMGMGAYAEFVHVPAGATVARKPAGLSHEEAASLAYGGVVARQLLDRTRHGADGPVLVIGASGAIGRALTSFLASDAVQVDAVGSLRSRSVAHDLGAALLWEYRSDWALGLEPGRYAAVYDVLGRAPYDAVRRALRPDGRLVYVSFKMSHLRRAAWSRLLGGPHVQCVLTTPGGADLWEVAAAVERGALRTAVGHTFPLSEAARAHAFVEDGLSSGAVVLQADA